MTPVLATARDTLAGFFLGVLDDPSEEGLAAQHAAHPDAAEAALSYLGDRHVRGAPPTEAWETTGAFARVLRMILTAGGDDAASRLVALALAVTDLRHVRAIAEVVVGVVPPDELAAALVEALRPASATTTRSTARELAYHTFDALGDAYAASPAVSARLAAALGRPAADASSSTADAAASS